MKRLIIYDLDGTIVDTRQDIAEAVNHMLAAMDTPGLPTDVIARHVGKGLHHLIQSCLKTSDPKKIEKAAKIYRDYYGAHMLDHSKLFPGVHEVLEYFRSKLQAVLTNKPEPYCSVLLKALGVGHYFTAIIGGGTDYPKKPDPAAVFSLMERENVTTEETLFIGDSLIDIETGRNAGVMTVALTHGFGLQNELELAKPHLLVDDFYELLRLAKGKRW